MSQENRKLIYLTINELNAVMQTSATTQPIFRGCKFEFAAVVARSLKSGHFSDGTGHLFCEPKRGDLGEQLQVGEYYQLTLSLRAMGSGFQPQLQNHRICDGNAITTSYIRILQQRLEEQRAREEEQGKQTEKRAQGQQNGQGNTKRRDGQLTTKIREWISQRSEFSYEQLLEQFGAGEDTEKVLLALEQEGIIGNMGDCYQLLI